VVAHGHAALAVRGIPVVPRDLDLVVSDEGAAAAASAFDDALIEPAVAVEGWFCRWWGRAWIGARVEWAGGVTNAADEPLPTDFGLVATASFGDNPLERPQHLGATARAPAAGLGAPRIDGSRPPDRRVAARHQNGEGACREDAHGRSRD
jgi:hypothetical protein